MQGPYRDIFLAHTTAKGERLLGLVEGGEAGWAAEVLDGRPPVNGGPDQVGRPQHRSGEGRDGRYGHTRLQRIQGKTKAQSHFSPLNKNTCFKYP